MIKSIKIIFSLIFLFTSSISLGSSNEKVAIDKSMEVLDDFMETFNDTLDPYIQRKIFF